MREIKFRAWDGENMNSEFIIVDTAWMMNKEVGCPVNAGFKNMQEQAENWIIMQYTGLKDKNGKEIYEGDILNTNTFRAKAVTPYIVEEALPFIKLVNAKGWAYDNGDYYEGGNIMSHEWKKFEVIGNIYENKDLLEAKEI